ncbi:MAG: hypothetical protein AB7F22_03485 [Reyranella sp.]|uniref:hypothetical protein n=1 Tax=Reyranella sp. TaxID=1929291 RepID=UPI003D09DADC
MPIHLDIFHPNRIVVVVARGAITSEDAIQAVREFVEKGMVHYRKIIDVSMVRTDMDVEQLKMLAELARSSPRATNRGPLAFVVDRMGNPLARVFAEMTEAERPVKVFTSLSEARRWLDEVSKV